MAATSFSSPSLVGELKPAASGGEEENKVIKLDKNLEINPRLLPPFKSSSSSYTSLSKYIEENINYFGGGTLIINPSSLSISLNFIPSSSSPSFLNNMTSSATPQDAVEHHPKGDENMTAELITTGDGQKQQQHLHLKKRDQQDDTSDVEASTKKRRTSTSYVLQEEEEEDENIDDNSQNKNEIKHEIGQVSGVSSADSALDISCSSREKTSAPLVLDYATALRDHRYNDFDSLDVNLYEAADLLKCIPDVYPVDQRSELERQTGKFPRDWFTHHRDPSVRYLDTYLDTNCDRDMKKIYEFDGYKQVQNLFKTFDKNTVEGLKRFADMMPMTKEVFTCDMNWEVVNKYALHEIMEPWISNIAKTSTYGDADELAYYVLDSLKNHGSASSVHEMIMSFKFDDDVEPVNLFLNVWAMLFSEIKKLEEVNGKKPSSVDIINDTPKRLEEMLSLDINWTIFDQHKELHEKMKSVIRTGIMELLEKEKASMLARVVNCIRNQNRPLEMLELLDPFLDDDTEVIVRILWRTLLILVKIIETAFPMSISSANPSTELSNVEGMPSDNILCQRDPVCNDEESSDRARGVIERNRRYSYPSFWRENKIRTFETLCELNRLEDAIPKNIEELSSYKVDWVVSDREELHNRLRPWIFREIKEFVRQEKEANLLVESIVSGIKEHVNAKDMMELAKPWLGDRSAAFIPHLWMKLVFGIHLANTTGLDSLGAVGRDREKVKASQYFGDRYSRNRHFMMVEFDYDNLLKLKQINETMPKTKEELFSCEIKWDVYEKYGLQKNMRKGIWIETLELIRQKKEAMPVEDQIMWSIFDYHVSASMREFTAREEAIPVFEEIMSRLCKDRACPSKMVEFLEPTLGNRAEKFVMKMWHALICGIKFAEAGVEKKCSGGSVVLLRVEDQDL